MRYLKKNVLKSLVKGKITISQTKWL